MNNTAMKFAFNGVSAEVLEEKLKDAIEKFNLSAQYEDGFVTIYGNKEQINQIWLAYQMQKAKSFRGGFNG